MHYNLDKSCSNKRLDCRVGDCVTITIQRLKADRSFFVESVEGNVLLLREMTTESRGNLEVDVFTFVVLRFGQSRLIINNDDTRLTDGVFTAYINSTNADRGQSEGSMIRVNRSTRSVDCAPGDTICLEIVSASMSLISAPLKVDVPRLCGILEFMECRPLASASERGQMYIFKVKGNGNAKIALERELDVLLQLGFHSEEEERIDIDVFSRKPRTFEVGIEMNGGIVHCFLKDIISISLPKRSTREEWEIEEGGWTEFLTPVSVKDSNASFSHDLEAIDAGSSSIHINLRNEHQMAQFSFRIDVECRKRKRKGTVRVDRSFRDEHTRTGFKLLEAGEIVLAFREFDSALRSGAGDPGRLLNRGFSALLMGRGDLALNDFDKALHNMQHGSNVDILDVKFNRGMALRQVGQLDRSLSDFTECIDIDNEDSYSYLNRGEIYTQKNMFSQALEDFNCGILHNQAIPELLNNRGYCLMRIGDLDGAKDDFNRSIELKNDYANAFCNRAECYRKEHNYVKCCEDYKTYLEINSQDVDILLRKACIEFKLGNYEQAIDDSTSVIAIDDSNFEAYSCRGMSLYRLGDCHSALADLKMSVMINPKFYAGHFNKGIVCCACGALPEAVKAFEIVLSDNAKDLEALLWKSSCYAQLGNINAAELGVRQITLQDPNHKAAQELLRKLKDAKNHT